MRSWLVIVGFSLTGAACKSRSEPPSTAAPLAIGAERGACRADRSCDPGLLCLSELCVRPPPAECAKVGEALGGIFLDNYSPREVRDRFAAEVRTQCESGLLSREDGACLAKAKSRRDIQACPHPIGLGDCKKINAAAAELRVKSGADAYLVTAADRLVQRCDGEIPTSAFERCVLAATSMADLERCVW